MHQLQYSMFVKDGSSAIKASFNSGDDILTISLNQLIQQSIIKYIFEMDEDDVVVQELPKQQQILGEEQILKILAAATTPSQSEINAIINTIPNSPKILGMLIDACLRPTAFTIFYKTPLSPEIAARSLDILTNQLDNFADVAINQVELLHAMFVEGEAALQDTPISYFNKLMTPLYYQKQAQVVSFYASNPIILRNVMSKLHLKGMLEWISKMIELQENKNYFVNEKSGYMQLLSALILDQTDNEILAGYLETLRDLLAFLNEKADDRYEYGKVIELYKEFANTINKILQYLRDSFAKSQKIFNCSLQIATQILKQDAQIMLNKLSSTSPGRKNSISLSGAFYGDQDAKKEKYNVKHNDLLEIGVLLLKMQNILFATTTQKQNQNKIQIQKDIQKPANINKSGKTLILYFKSLRMFIKILNNTIYEIDRAFQINKFMTNQFLIQITKIIKDHPLNNMLHNAIKETLIQWIKGDKQIMQFEKLKHFIDREGIFFILFANAFKRKINENIFEVQLYHIFKELMKRLQQFQANSTYKDVMAMIQQKQKFYEQPICYNPKNALMDSSHQSNSGRRIQQQNDYNDNVDEERQEVVEQIVQIQIYSPSIPFGQEQQKYGFSSQFKAVSLKFQDQEELMIKPKSQLSQSIEIKEQIQNQNQEHEK